MAQSGGADGVELLVCVKCRFTDGLGSAGDTAAADDTEPRPGTQLCRELADTAPDGVVVRPVECLSNCSNGCSIVLRGPDRWTYVYGNFTGVADADTIREGAARYRDSRDGLVPWRERPEHFRKNCIARVPPLTAGPPAL